MNKYLLNIFIFISFLLSSSLNIIANQNKKSYDSFELIEWDTRIPAYDFENDKDYYLYKEVSGSSDIQKIYKLKTRGNSADLWCDEFEESLNEEDVCMSWQTEGSKSNNDLSGHLTNLYSNTLYNFFIAPEGIDGPILSKKIVENSRYTFAKPLDFTLIPGFNFIEILIDKNTFNYKDVNHHDVLIKIKIIETDETFYLDDEYLLSYEPTYLNTMEINDINTIKDKIMPNFNYEVSIISRNEDEIRSRPIVKKVKTTKIILPDDFSINFDNNKFNYIINQLNTDQDILTNLSVYDIDRNEVIHTLSNVKTNTLVNMNFDFNLNLNQKIKFLCFNEYLGSYSDTLSVDLDYFNIYSDKDIVKDNSKISIPKLIHTFDKPYFKDDLFIIDFSLAGLSKDYNVSQFDLFINSKDYEKIFKNYKSTDENINFVYFKRKNDLNTLSVPSFTFTNLFKIDNNDFISYKLKSNKTNNTQTYLYNISYGEVLAEITQTNSYEAIKDKIITLPTVKINQRDLAILGPDDRVQIIIPDNIDASWDDSNLTQVTDFNLSLLNSKVLEITIEEPLKLDESIDLNDLGMLLLTDKAFDLKLNIKITSKTNNYSVTKDVIMPTKPIKIGRLNIDYISSTDIFEEGIENDPEPYIREIILVDDINIMDKDNIIELELFSGAIEFDPKKGKPKTDLEIIEFSSKKITLKGFSKNNNEPSVQSIRNIPIIYPSGTSDNNNDFSENSIELSVNGKIYNQQPDRKKNIFHQARLYNFYIDTQLDRFQLNEAKISPHTFNPSDTLIIGWYNNFSKEQIDLLSKGITDKYRNLEEIESDKKTIKFIYKANNQRSQGFKLSENIPPIKRIDQEQWEGVENIYFNIRGNRAEAKTTLVKINYGELKFKFNEYPRYAMNESEYTLPQILITQNGEPLIIKGDIIALYFDNNDLVQWKNDKIEDSEYFNFVFEDNKLILEAKQNISNQKIILPNIKFLVNSAIPLEIKLKADFNQNNVIYDIKYNDKYLELGQLFLDNYSNTPIFFKENTNKLFNPMDRIKYLTFRNYGNIIEPKDTIVITFSSDRLVFDLDKDILFDSKVKKVFQDKNKISLVVNEAFESFSIKDIHLSYLNDSKLSISSTMEEDPENIYLEYYVLGYLGKYQQSTNQSKIFHKSEYKNIFVEKTSSNHELSEFVFTSKNIKDIRDSVIIESQNQPFTSIEYKMFSDNNKLYPYKFESGKIYTSKLLNTRAGKIKINSLILDNLFYKNLKQNKILYKLRGNNTQTYLYNISYGEVLAEITQTNSYEAIKDKIITLPTVKINQRDLAILGPDDRVQIIIPDNIDASWDDSNLTQVTDFNLSLLNSKVLEITIEEPLKLDESIDLNDLGMLLLTDKAFDLKLNIKITSKTNNYSVTKDVIMPTKPIKIGRLNIDYISSTDIFEEGIENDPEPYIREIILVDDINIMDKDNIIELELFSGAIEFDPKKGKPKTDLEIIEFSSKKITLKGFSKNNNEPSVQSIRNIPIIYPSGTSDNNNDFSENSIELSVNGKIYNQQPDRKKNIFHQARLYNFYIDTQLDRFQLNEAKISPHTFNPSDTLIIGWYNNFSKEQIDLLSKGITDKYRNLEEIESDKKTIKFIYKANNQRSQGFKLSENIPPIKRIDQEQWEGVENIYFNIRGNRAEAKTTLVKINYGELKISIPENRRYLSGLDKNLLLPNIIIKQNLTGILNKNDKIILEIDKDNPMGWSSKNIDLSNNESFPFNVNIDTKYPNQLILESKNDYLDADQIVIDSLKVDLLTDESFELKISSLLKFKSFTKRKDININQKGILIGKPIFNFMSELGQDNISGIIFGRPYNRMLDLSLSASEKSILDVNDTIKISIVNDSIRWSNTLRKIIKIKDKNLNKLEFLYTSDDKKTIYFKVKQPFSDLEKVIISGLATDKIEREQISSEYINIKIDYKFNKLYTKTIDAQKIQDIYVDFNFNDVMYQNDVIDDIIKTYLRNFDRTIKTFWQNEDKLIFYLPSFSGAKWKKIEEYNYSIDNNQIFVQIDLYSWLKDYNKFLKSLTPSELIKQNKQGYQIYPLHLESNKNEKENFFNIKYRFYNSNDKKNDFNPSYVFDEKYYNINYLERPILFSSLDFDMKSNKGIFAAVKSFNPFKIPDITINQNELSHLYKNDTIRIEVQGQISPLVFINENLNELSHDNIKLKYIEDGNTQINQKYELSFIVEEVMDTKKPINIKNLDMKLIQPLTQNKEVSLILYVNSIRQGRGKFISDKIIRLGVPRIDIKRNDLIWPISTLFSPEIIIDDTKSKILSNSKDPIKIKISRTKDFTDTLIFWDSNYIKDGYNIERQHLIKLNPEDKVIKIEPHKFKGFKEFEDISSNGDYIYIAISFDGQNYPIRKELALIHRPKEVSFSNSTIHKDLDTKVQFLPKLFIKENKNNTTIKKGSTLILELNEKVFNWIQTNDYPVIINSTLDANPCKISYKSKSKLEISFIRDLKPKEIVTLANLKIDTKKSFNKESLNVYFKTNHNDYKVQLNKRFNILNNDLDISLEKNSKIKKIDKNIIYSLRDKGINSINNFYPNVVLSEKTKFSSLKENDTIIVEFPYQLDMNYIKNKFSANVLRDENYQITNINDENSSRIIIAISDEIKDSSLVLPEIKFKYPDKDKILDPEKIKFVKINKTQKKLDVNYEYTENDLSLSAGQPTIYLKESQELFKNNGRQKLSEILIIEDKYLNHFKKGDEFKLVLTDVFGASWESEKANNADEIFINNPKIKFIKRIDDNNLLFKVNDELDNLETFSIKGLFIKDYKSEYNSKNQENTYPIGLNFTNHYPGKSINTDLSKGGHDFITGNQIGGNIDVRPVYLTLTGASNTIINDDGAGISNEGTLPNIKVYFKDVVNKRMIPKKVYIQLYSYDNINVNPPERRNNNDFSYNWIKNQKYQVNGSEYKATIKQTINEELSLKNQFIEINNPNQDDELEITGLSLKTPRISDNDDINGYYSLGLYFINPEIYPNDHESFKISTSTYQPTEDSDIVYTEAVYSEEECKPDYDWYKKGKTISVIVNNKGDDKVVFDPNYVPCLSAKGSSDKICADLPNKTSIDSLEFNLTENLKAGAQYEINNLKFTIEGNPKGQKLKANIKVRINTELGDVYLYTKKSEIEVGTRSYKDRLENQNRIYRDRITNTDLTSRNIEDASKCWLSGNDPNMILRLGKNKDPNSPLYQEFDETFEIWFTIAEEENQQLCAIIEEDILFQYESFFDFDNKVVKKTINDDEFLELKDELVMQSKSAGFSEFSALNPECYYYSMSLIHRIYEDDKGLQQGKEYYEQYKAKSSSPKDLGYNLEATISEIWNDYYNYSNDKDSENWTAFKADSVLNRMISRFKNSPKDQFKKVRADRIVVPYNEFTYYKTSINNAKNLNDYYLIIKKHIDNSSSYINKKEYNLTGEYIKKIKNKSFQRNVMRTVFNRKESKVNFELSEIDNEDKLRARSLKNKIDNGYGYGYNKDLKKADELKASNLKSIKVNYKHNKRAIPIPLTLSVFSSNIYYDNNKNKRQNYIIYHSKKLNETPVIEFNNLFDFETTSESISNYNLYGGGKYLLIPNSYLDKQKKINSLKFYSRLFLFTAGLKIYLSEQNK